MPEGNTLEYSIGYVAYRTTCPLGPNPNPETDWTDLGYKPHSSRELDLGFKDVLGIGIPTWMRDRLAELAMTRTIREQRQQETNKK